MKKHCNVVTLVGLRWCVGVQAVVQAQPSLACAAWIWSILVLLLGFRSQTDTNT